MKKSIFTLGVLLLFLACGSSKKSSESSTTEAAKTVSKSIEDLDPQTIAETITSDELKELLYTFASDEFEGRETGEKGQKMAIEYLKTQYQDMGVPSPLGGTNYFQNVPLIRQKVTVAEVAINGVAFNAFEDQIVLQLPEAVDLQTTDIVYVGYGIDADNYSDYKNVDVKGKIVLAKAGEPKDAAGNFITSGNTEATKWTNGRQSISSKREVALKNGAKALIYIDNALFARYSAFYKRQYDSGAAGRLSLESNEPDVMFMMASEKLGQAIYADLMTDNDAKALKTDLSLKAEDLSEELNSENVVAYIKGSEMPDELIIISAHLDHVGVNEGEVFNGADDDGSGTVAVVEIAEAFQTAVKDGYTPKRSILFLHVTGEEKGLLGSKYYTDMDPLFPLENTVADLNIDMIGRIDPKRTEGDRNYVYLIGSDKLSSDLHNISEEVNSKYCNVELDYTYNDENDPNRFYYRSDHYNFAKNNIPVIFYFNGTHDDYHKASDTPDKIEYDLLENRARLVFHTAWVLANRDQRITVDKVAP